MKSIWRVHNRESNRYLDVSVHNHLYWNTRGTYFEKLDDAFQALASYLNEQSAKRVKSLGAKMDIVQEEYEPTVTVLTDPRITQLGSRLVERNRVIIKLNKSHWNDHYTGLQELAMAFEDWYLNGFTHLFLFNDLVGTDLTKNIAKQIGLKNKKTVWISRRFLLTNTPANATLIKLALEDVTGTHYYELDKV